MDIHKLKWTILGQDIFSLLCRKAGERLSQREIAKLLHVSPTAVANALPALKEGSLIKVEKTKTINFVSLNRDGQKAIELKRAENLKTISVSGLSDYLYHALAGGTIILFGSYSRGEDTSTSDIDIAVIGRDDKVLELETYERALQRKILVNFYRSWAAIHRHLRNNILSGIVLHGSVEL